MQGKEFEGAALEFGEEVWYMKPGIVGKDKLDVRWHSGIWLGSRERSGEPIIGTRDGCIKVRSVRRKQESERWSGEEWRAMKGVPWEAVPGHQD